MVINKIVSNVSGKEILLRSPNENDAQILIDYLKQTCSETRFLVKEPEDINLTIQDEIEYINKCNQSESTIEILGFMDGKHVGNCSIRGFSESRFRHRVSLGIALFLEYTNMGIGRIMINELINIAKAKGYEQIELEVNTDNDRAIHLYKSVGFEIYGTFPKNMKFKDGTYADIYLMILNL